VRIGHVFAAHVRPTHGCMPQTSWINGTRNCYGVISYPSKHGNPRITVDVSRRAPLLFSPTLFSFRSCANTSPRLSRHTCEELTCSHRALVSRFSHALRSSLRWFCHVPAGIRVDIEMPSHRGSCFSRRGRRWKRQRRRTGSASKVGVLRSTVGSTFHFGLEARYQVISYGSSSEL